jgi:hypothetical protein
VVRANVRIRSHSGRRSHRDGIPNSGK